MENVIQNQVFEAINSGIEAISMEDKLNMKMLAEKINELIEFANSNPKVQSRSRGPVSEKTMTEDDARRVMLGDLKELGHKAAAEVLGLSYGQIYSARKGFTFKSIYKEMIHSV